MRPMGGAGQSSAGLIACAPPSLLESFAKYAPHRLDSALNNRTPQECWNMMAPRGTRMPEGWLLEGRWR